MAIIGDVVTRQDLDNLRRELKNDIATVGYKVDALQEELRQDRAENRAQYAEIVGYLKPS